jgi:ATP-dependent helicase/nuclease subunit B
MGEMSLTLVLGPANAAKAGEVLGAYEQATRRGDSPILVVPTAADAAHYDRELSDRNPLIGRTLTFPALATEIAVRTGYGERRLSELQRTQILRRAIERLGVEVLERSSAATGFAAAAGALIAELQRELVTPQRFVVAMQAWARQDERRAAYAGEVAGLYLAYVLELDQLRRVDRELYAWRALDRLRAEPGAWGATPVFFYGFDDLTALERDAIETLARIAGADVTVSLTYEPGRPALSARATVVEELRAVAASVRELPALADHYEPGARAVLHHVERGLFEPPGERLDPGDTVVLLEAGGELAEAELIASEVRALLQAGVAASEIAIVCRSLQRSAALLERALERFGIPAVSERTVPIAHTALGRGLLALARCALLGEEATAGDLIAYLRTPGVVDRLERVDEIEAGIRRAGIHGAEQARAMSGLTLGELDSLRDARDPTAELARHARRLLAAPRRQAAAVLDGDERRDARAAAAIIRACADLDELEARPTAVELLGLLRTLEVPATEAASDAAVLLAEPLAIRARRFRAVLVCGLCEGEFPAAGAVEPFLSDDRRHELALASGLALEQRGDNLARERYLLYACLSRATDKLVLSYRSSDEDGNLVLPSPFLADVAELFVPEWRERRRRRLLADVVWDPAQAPTTREQRLSLAAAGAGIAPAAGGPEARTLGPSTRPYVRHREILSGGALESFAQCPVKWLVERQLQPRELGPEPEPMVRGNFMHSVLEQLFGRLGGPLTETSVVRAEQLVGELTTALPDEMAPGRPESVRAAILRGIVADLRRYLESEAGDGLEWTPQALELRFGLDEDEGALPPLTLGAGEERVLIRGMIDRVDVNGRQAVVRDYKSGSSRRQRGAAKWLSESELQVALYMIAVRRLLDLEPVAGLYQPLTGRELRPSGAYLNDVDVSARAYRTDALAPEQLDEVLAEVEARAVALAAQLRRGELVPCPETCSRDGCRHPGICWAG